MPCDDRSAHGPSGGESRQEFLAVDLTSPTDEKPDPDELPTPLDSSKEPDSPRDPGMRTTGRHGSGPDTVQPLPAVRERSDRARSWQLHQWGKSARVRIPVQRARRRVDRRRAISYVAYREVAGAFGFRRLLTLWSAPHRAPSNSPRDHIESLEELGACQLAEAPRLPPPRGLPRQRGRRRSDA